MIVALAITGGFILGVLLVTIAIACWYRKNWH